MSCRDCDSFQVRHQGNPPSLNAEAKSAQPLSASDEDSGEVKSRGEQGNIVSFTGKALASRYCERNTGAAPFAREGQPSNAGLAAQRNILSSCIEPLKPTRAAVQQGKDTSTVVCQKVCMTDSRPNTTVYTNQTTCLELTKEQTAYDETSGRHSKMAELHPVNKLYKICTDHAVVANKQDDTGRKRGAEEMMADEPLQVDPARANTIRSECDVHPLPGLHAMKGKPAAPHNELSPDLKRNCDKSRTVDVSLANIERESNNRHDIHAHHHLPERNAQESVLNETANKSQTWKSETRKIQTALHLISDNLRLAKEKTSLEAALFQLRSKQQLQQQHLTNVLLADNDQMSRIRVAIFLHILKHELA